MHADPGPRERIKNVLRGYPKGIGITEISRKTQMHRVVASKYLELLKVSGEVEMHRSGMSKIYSLTVNPSLSRNISPEKELEQKITENKWNMEFLSRKVTEFLNLSPDANIYDTIGEGVLEIVPDAVVCVTVYDHETGTMTAGAFLGDTNGVFSKHFHTTVGLNMPLGDSDILNIIASGNLIRVPGGIHSATFDQVPPLTAGKIEEELPLKRIYSIGLASGKEVLGIIGMFKRADEPIENPDLLIAYARISALALKAVKGTTDFDIRK